jgi:hypothetical protein
VQQYGLVNYRGGGIAGKKGQIFKCQIFKISISQIEARFGKQINRVLSKVHGDLQVAKALVKKR